jgi:hypothetical protein
VSGLGSAGSLGNCFRFCCSIYRGNWLNADVPTHRDNRRIFGPYFSDMVHKYVKYLDAIRFIRGMNANPTDGNINLRQKWQSFICQRRNCPHTMRLIDALHTKSRARVALKSASSQTVERVN